MGAISFPDPFRRLSVPPLAGLEGQGCGDLGCRGAAAGLLSALPQHSSSFQCSHPNAFLQPHLHQGGCSGGGHLGLNCHGCCGACSTHFSWLLQPSVRSVADLEVIASGHRPLPSHSLCGRVSLPDGDHSVCAPGGASGGLDGLHPSDGSVPSSAGSSASRHFLRFLFRDTAYQFKALCFGLSTAPQVFTRVMAPVSSILHSMGIRMRRYLDDWLVQSSSRESLLEDLQTVLQLCHELGIVVNPQKSNLVPSQVVQYLGVVIASTSFRASPSVERISRLQSTAAAFQSCASPTASLWLSLLGVLSSLAHLVPGGRLRVRSLQLCLHRSWDRRDLEAPVFASMECLRDLQWWLHLPRLSLGVSLCQVSPDLHFWSDASDVGWGAHLDRQIASGLWGAQQAVLFINARELLDVQLGLYQFRSSLQGRTVAVFCDNTTAVAYLRKEGGTRSPLLNTLAQEILRWTESLSIRLAPQFLPGSNNVLADALSRPHQLPHSEWSLNLTVFQSLRRLAGPNRFICHLRQSSLFDLLLTIPGSVVGRHGRVSPVLGQSSGLRVPSGGYHSACSREAPGLHGAGAHPSGSTLGPAPLVLGPAPAFAGSSSGPTVPSRPLALASVSSPLPGSPSAQASCLATLQRFTEPLASPPQ